MGSLLNSLLDLVLDHAEVGNAYGSTSKIRNCFKYLLPTQHIECVDIRLSAHFWPCFCSHTAIQQQRQDHFTFTMGSLPIHNGLLRNWLAIQNGHVCTHTCPGVLSIGVLSTGGYVRRCCPKAVISMGVMSWIRCFS